MPTPISAIETLARLRLVEVTPRFWSSDEIVQIVIAGIKDLWRDIVDLKQEHFLTINATDVYMGANATTLSGLPADIHKVYNIEPRDLTQSGTTHGTSFKPLDYNHRFFQQARSLDAVDPTDVMIYYSISQAGAPVGVPIIYVAPKISSTLNIAFGYVPTLPSLLATSNVPIPGEADNALVAWTVSFALSKEREDKSPDPNWLSIYATEKQHLLESLGVRQYQEPQYVDAQFEDYWG